MAVHVIAGVMGSGKSYEAVKEKVLPAIQAGRRVVTNLDGLNHQKIAEHLKLSEERVRELLVVVFNEQVQAVGEFWYHPEEAPGATVQPGDLVLLDEAWNFFQRGDKLAPRVMDFFRMHRHYTHAETELSCDIVLCTQSIRGLHNDIRDVVEVRFQCRKMKVMGRPDKYQVWMYEADERKASHHYDRKYEAHIFPLYKSYASGKGKEEIDQRQNALNRPFFKLVIPGAILCILAGIPLAWYSLDKLTSGKSAKTSIPQEATPPAPFMAPSAAGTAATPGNAKPKDDKKAWRVVSSYMRGSLPVVLVVDDKGRYRSLTPGSYSRGAADDEVYVAVPVEDTSATPISGDAPTYAVAPSK